MSSKLRVQGFSALAIAVVAFACAGPAPTGGAPETFEEALARSSNRGTPVLLDFFTEW